MPQPLRLLIIEDNARDAELAVSTLENTGYACTWNRVDDRAGFLKSLNQSNYDVILTDYKTARFDGLTALQLLRERNPDLPFIFVSGTVGEEIAIESLKAGATDYVVKRHLDRLALVVERALKERRERRRRYRAEEELLRSEERFRQVIVSISDHIYVTELTDDGRYINRYLSPHVEALTGYPLENFMADRNFWPSTVIHPDDRSSAASQSDQLAKGLNSETEYRIIKKDGQVLWVRDSARVQREGVSIITYGLVSNITARKHAEEEVSTLNESLEQRIVDRTRELSALYEVTAVASESLDLREKMDRSLERILAAMRTNMGAIHLLDDAGTGLTLAAHQGLRPDVVALMQDMSPQDNLLGWVFKNREPLVIPNITADTRVPQTLQASGLYTYAGVPMRARGRTLGILSVLGQEKQQFNIEEVALLISIADQVGVAVENARLRQRAERAAVIEERERLARELHDSVTQSLYSLTLFAEAGSEFVKSGNPDAIAHNFTRMGETAQQALKEMRLLVHQLRPLDLEQEGLAGALHRRLSAVEARVNVKGRLVAEELVDLPATVEEGLYRIAQEALNNALKHANATSVTVYLRVKEDMVELEVVDDGLGFNPDAAIDSGGIGMDSMRERARQLGATLTVASQPGHGTRVMVQVKV